MQKDLNYKNFKIHFLLSQTRITLLHSVSVMFFLLSAAGCSKFVEVDPPVNKITTENLFNNDADATSAVVGTYSLMSNSLLNIANGAITAYMGVASDELNYASYSTDISEFQTNSITTNNSTNLNDLWASAYKYIYQANACIEGISASNGITPKTKNQLLGECKVIRSLMYFYLVQLYGDVPLITTTNFNGNSQQPRSSTQDIYNLIISDLNDAKKLLSASYPTSGRLRPNIYTAEALLARIYLFTGNWAQAEQEASGIINSGQYSLEPDLTKVFLASSHEAIWQISQSIGGFDTREGSTFVNDDLNAIPDFLISDPLMNGFEAGDPRKSVWVGTRTIDNKTYYFPYKYKIANSQTVTEHYIMFRLAEQYLIRSEARIRQGKTDAGVSDLNIIRQRARGNNNTTLADLPPGQTQEQALSYVLNERRLELMSEWGNRWFDLKRLHLSGAVLKPLKPSWKDSDTLFPIPLQEIMLNKNLTQNNGYN